MMKKTNKSIGGPNITLLVQILEKNLLTIRKTTISSRYVCLNDMNIKFLALQSKDRIMLFFASMYNVFVVSSIFRIV